jgi:hypothetical protein
MTLHSVANDYGLRANYQHCYDRIARRLFLAAVAGGWTLNLWIEPAAVAVGLLFAFLASGVVLNVLKEELPEDEIPSLCFSLAVRLVMRCCCNLRCDRLQHVIA